VSGGLWCSGCDGNKVLENVEGSRTMSKILSREQILQQVTLKREEVEIPEWGGSVLVRELTAAERDSYENSLLETKKGLNGKPEIRPNLKNVKAKMASIVLIDEAGNRLFKDADALQLGNLSASALNRIVDVAERLSGLTKKDVEELEGNSESGQDEDSFSS